MLSIRNLSFVGAALFVAHGSALAGFTVTYEAPGVTNTTATFDYKGVENFDSLALGVQSFTTNFGTTGQPKLITGTYSNVQINAADQFGGAGDTGNYGVAFANTPYQLALSAQDTGTNAGVPVTYFGYWLSALDAGNQVEFYRGDDKVFSFDPAAVLDITGNCPPASGQPSRWCGNPVTGENMREPYVFLNFYDTSGLGFDKVSFFEKPGVGGYESDNHTVGYYKTIGGSEIPEPTTLALVGLALAGLSSVRRRKQ